MVEINGEPFIAHQLRLLRANGIEHVVLCVSHLGDLIRDFVGDGRGFGLQAAYAWDGPALRGTAGAIRNALPLLGQAFFVLYGDSYLPCSFEAVEREFQSWGRLALMTVFRNEGRWDTSNVEFDAGCILAYDKRNRTPRMHHIDYGLSVFRREVFERWEHADLEQIHQELLREKQLAAVEVQQRFYEIGSVEGIRELSNFLK
jgi:NDP-sugar pyrophosphorylase family protein